MPPMVDELVIHCTNPVITEVVPSVTTSEGILKNKINSELTKPTRTPITMTMASTSRIGICIQTFSTPMIAEQSVSVAPTERS